MERSSNKEGTENMNKFFMGVRKERSATASVDTSFVTATNTENPLSNDVTPLTSCSAISVDYTEQESIPDASIPINKKSTLNKDELSVAIGAEKDILFLLHKKRDHGLLTQENRKELKSRETKLVEPEKALTVFPTISAGPQISTTLLSAHIEISASL